VPGGWLRLTRGESHDGGTTWFDVAARFIGADKARADVRNLVEEPGPGGFGQCEGPEKSAPPPSRWKPAGLSRPACLKTPFWRHDTTRHPQGEVYGKPTRDISRYGLSGDARVIDARIACKLDNVSSEGASALFTFVVGDACNTSASTALGGKPPAVVHRLRNEETQPDQQEKRVT
jgi:hypothetical protein